MSGLGEERQFGRLDRGWENIRDNVRVLPPTNEAPDTAQPSGRNVPAQLSSEILPQNYEDGITLINPLNCLVPHY